MSPQDKEVQTTEPSAFYRRLEDTMRSGEFSLTRKGTSGTLAAIRGDEFVEVDTDFRIAGNATRAICQHLGLPPAEVPTEAWPLVHAWSKGKNLYFGLQGNQPVLSINGVAHPINDAPRDIPRILNADGYIR